MFVTDPVFGTLEFRDDWMRPCTQELYGRVHRIDLLVGINDSKHAIRDEQRSAYKEFCDRNAIIASRVENAIFKYYIENCEEWRDTFGEYADQYAPHIRDKSEMAPLVRLTGILFPLVLKSGQLRTHFLLECTWDIESGLGVALVDDEITVGTQDLVI